MKRIGFLLLIVRLAQNAAGQALPESAPTPAPIAYATAARQRVFWAGRQQPMVAATPQAESLTGALNQSAVPDRLGRIKPVADLTWADMRSYAQPPASTGQSQPRASRAGRRVAGIVLIGGGVSLMVYSTAWYKNRLDEEGRQARQTGQYGPLFQQHTGWDAASGGMFLGGLFAALGGVVLLIK